MERKELSMMILLFSTSHCTATIMADSTLVDHLGVWNLVARALDVDCKPFFPHMLTIFIQ
jgi:hypothetical protein